MLTKRQKEVLKAIYYYNNANGMSPSIRNLCDLLGLKSKRTVYSHLTELESQGFITKRDNIHRSIKITDRGLSEIRG
ncbi:LexA family protein [Inediibacterium massiliense]|uniref:LexA family protein n=1 Tax=Inediibacterium massiliense TaxID=1658111 RepID=UPI0006B42B2C|nr:helix-turn-helix domain-containing protein [Inediibacterium massiliense]